MKKLGIYIHIPFCRSKCLYCGFYSKGGAAAAEQEDYIRELLEDIEAYGQRYGKAGEDYLADTVFIGGGTPSLLDAALIGQVLDCLRAHFTVDPEAEITIETNPGTLTADKLSAYRSFGINRLSMGVQSLDNGILKSLGRIHTAEEFAENFALARKAGFDNINLDLMFAVPGHTMEIWEDTLRRAMDMGPAHISFYSLQIEEDTPFYRMFAAGEIDQIPDELDRQMYHSAVAMLSEAGYAHYEISNAAKPGFQCRHNLKYWSMEEYLGIGAGASSYIDGCRFTEGPSPEFHQNTRADDMSEFVFTGLRKTCGISLDEFAGRFGRPFWEVYGGLRPELAPFFEAGQLIEEGGVLRLSEEGIDISNAVMAVFV